MSYFSLFSVARPVPVEYRANFVHLYLDIAWFGVLSGSAMAFMAVYVARQGADTFQLGLITAGPALVNLVCALPAGRWLERQAIAGAVFWASVFHRAFYLLWIPLPHLLAPPTQIWVVIGLTLLMGIPGTALAIGFNQMFAEVVPPAWRGQVVATRNALLAAALIGASLLCGAILTHFPFPLNYELVFGIGFLGAAMSSLHLWFVSPGSNRSARSQNGLGLGDRAWPGVLRFIGDSLRPNVGLRFLIRNHGSNLLRIEVLTGPFGKVILILFIFHLAQFLAIPIFPLYFVQKLHLTDQVISLGNALFYVTLLLVSTQLAQLTERLGFGRVTGIGAMVMSCYPGLLALSRGVELFLVASVVGGLAWALAGGAINNYILEKVPDQARPAHLAWYNLTLNASILLGSLLGPLFAGYIGLTTALAAFALLRVLAALSILRWGG